MTDIERLHETIQQLSYENAQLSRFKKINRLMLEGLDAILCSDNHDEVFARLFLAQSFSAVSVVPCFITSLEILRYTLNYQDSF